MTVGKVLVVDDDARIAQILARLLGAEGYAVDVVNDGETAISAVALHAPDIVLLDVGLPAMNGFEVCRHLKSDPATRMVPVVLITGHAAREHRIEGIKAGANDFLTKPFNKEELQARVRSLVQLKRHTDELESAESVIMSLALTVEARDAYTRGHCERLAIYAVVLGTDLDLPAAALDALKRGATLHDVGKIGIPDEVLLKSAELTPAEFRIMQRHTTIGDSLCGDMRSLAPVRPIVRHHHERLDGSGYPDGLSGDAVPLLAQIVGIVDAYDAMTTIRPYRGARTVREACAELLKDSSDGKFSYSLVDPFVQLIRSERVTLPERD